MIQSRGCSPPLTPAQTAPAVSPAATSSSGSHATADRRRNSRSRAQAIMTANAASSNAPKNASSPGETKRV